MSLTPRFLLAVTLLVITAHRLPAPISEVPEPTASATLQPKLHAKPQPKLTPKPPSLFGQTWMGTVIIQGTCFGQTVKMPFSYTVKVSQDGTTVWTHAGTQTEFQALAHGNGQTLSWTHQDFDSSELGTAATTFTLRLNSIASATLESDQRSTINGANCTIKGIGAVTKR